MNGGYNNPYLYEVSCYDCVNCGGKRDLYCQNACIRCYQMYPQIFTNFNPLSPSIIWYNPSQFPYGNYYGTYYSPTLMY